MTTLQVLKYATVSIVTALALCPAIASAQQPAFPADQANQNLLGGGGGAPDFAITNCDFGSVRLNGGWQEAVGTVTITNLSSKLPLTIDSIASDSLFQQPDPLPIRIPPAGSFHLRFAVHPTKAGYFYGHAFFTSNAIKTTHYDSLYITVLAPLSVSSEENGGGLMLTSIERLANTLRVHYLAEGRTSIEICSIDGEQVLCQSSEGSFPDHVAKFNVSALSSGRYFVRLMQNGQVVSRLFAIER